SSLPYLVESQVFPLSRSDTPLRAASGRGSRLVLGRSRAFPAVRLGSISFLNSRPYFLMVGNTIDTVTSMLTKRELNSHCSLFKTELRLEFPNRNSTIKDSPTGKISMYTRFVKFANFRVPLSKFLLCVLEYYQINLAQLFVIGATKVSHFELICRVLGRIPTVGTFRRFYVNSISNDWLSFSKRSGAAIPCCYSKNLDSLKNWNNCFFWIDASVCPLSIPWFNGTSVVKDPLPLDDAVDLPCVELLNENRTLIRKYPEIFLCVIGLSRSYAETDARPTFLYNDDEGRTLADNEVPLLEETEDRVISPSAQPISLKVRTDGVKISEPVPTTTGKSPVALRRLELQSETEGAESGSPDVLEDSGSTLDVNVQTRRMPERFVVTTSSSEHGNTNVSLRVKSPLPHDNARTSTSVPGEGSHVDEIYQSQTIDSAIAQDVYVPEWNITNDARHICMVSQLRLRYEHEIMSKERFQKKFTESSAVFQQKDAEIVALKAKLDTAEKEFNVELLGKVSTLESVHEELSNQDAVARHFEEQSAKLDAHIADVRRDMDTDLYPHMLTVIAGRRWVLGCAIRLTVMKCAQSSECHFAMGKVISLAINKGIQQGLVAGVKHGKAGRSLAQVKAYDYDVENKYVAAVSDFKNVSFYLLEELEALKDSSLALIMSALTLEGDADYTPKLRELQSSLDQVTVHVYSESSGSRGSTSISHEMLLSNAIPAIRGRTEKR
ncbi:hypothetical protein Tco_1242226, partial [Tanacetum coccineum]